LSVSFRKPGRLGELGEQIADERGWQIVAGEVMPEHVHLFVRVGPTEAPAAVVRACKEVLRPPSYFAALVGYVSEATVCRYIEHQWDAVMAP
jgi:putative transposase